MAADSADVSARLVTHALATLPADEWRVFHDIAWPGRRYANIDHVVIGPPGAFVIDSKNWSGEITVDGGVLRLNGRRREGAALAAIEAAASIKRLVVAIQDLPVHPVLCLAGEQENFGLAGDALLCSADNLASVLTARPAVLARAVREDVARQLAEKLADPESVRNVVPAQPHRVFLPKPSRLTPPPPGRSKGRRLGKADIASLLVGISLALGSLALLAADPDALGNLGHTVVDLVSNSDDSSDKPDRQPAIRLPTGYVPEDERSE